MNQYNHITKEISLGGFIGINGKDFKVIEFPQSEKGLFKVRSICEEAITYQMSYADIQRGLDKGAIDLEVEQFTGQPIAKMLIDDKDITPSFIR